jgi:hypothetical protein
MPKKVGTAGVGDHVILLGRAGPVVGAGEATAAIVDRTTRWMLEGKEAAATCRAA